MEWTTAYVNDLPDSSFAYVSPDGTRHLPFKDKEGNVDPAHLRNALARLNQTQIPPAAKASALKKLHAHAKGAGVNTSQEARVDLDAIRGVLQNHPDALVAFDDNIEFVEMAESAEHVDLVEFAPSGRIKHGKIHRSLGIIEGATMIGPMSSNGTHRKRRYSTQALKKIAQEAEGLPGYLNHVKPEDAFKPRDVRDIAIRHRNVRYDPTTDSVKSDMHVMPNHADLVFALAENFGDHIGNSLVSKGAVTMEGDTEVVQDILAIRSADLVTDPASTKGLFEGAESRERPLSITDLIESIQNTKGDTKVELSTILAHLKDNEPDRNLLAEHFGWVNKASAEKLQESNKALTVKVAEQDKALTESIAKLAVSEKTLTETKAEVDTYKAKEAVAAKQAKLQETIAAHGLSKDFGKVEGVISESFVAILEGQDEAMWSKMLDDRYAALKSVPVTRSQSPKSDTKDLSESSNGLPSDIYARVAAMVGR